MTRSRRATTVAASLASEMAHKQQKASTSKKGAGKPADPTNAMPSDSVVSRTGKAAAIATRSASPRPVKHPGPSPSNPSRNQSKLRAASPRESKTLANSKLKPMVAPKKDDDKKIVTTPGARKRAAKLPPSAKRLREEEDGRSTPAKKTKVAGVRAASKTADAETGKKSTKKAAKGKASKPVIGNSQSKKGVSQAGSKAAPSKLRPVEGSGKKGKNAATSTTPPAKAQDGEGLHKKKKKKKAVEPGSRVGAASEDLANGNQRGIDPLPPFEPARFPIDMKPSAELPGYPYYPGMPAALSGPVGTPQGALQGRPQPWQMPGMMSAGGLMSPMGFPLMMMGTPTSGGYGVFGPQISNGGMFICQFWGSSLNMALQQVDDKVAISGFTKTETGGIGEAEASGKVAVGDILVAINHNANGMGHLDTVVEALRSSPRPVILTFKRMASEGAPQIPEAVGYPSFYPPPAAASYPTSWASALPSAPSNLVPVAGPSGAGMPSSGGMPTNPLLTTAEVPVTNMKSKVKSKPSKAKAKASRPSTPSGAKVSRKSDPVKQRPKKGPAAKEKAKGSKQPGKNSKLPGVLEREAQSKPGPKPQRLVSQNQKEPPSSSQENYGSITKPDVSEMSGSTKIAPTSAAYSPAKPSKQPSVSNTGVGKTSTPALKPGPPPVNVSKLTASPAPKAADVKPSPPPAKRPLAPNLGSPVYQPETVSAQVTFSTSRRVLVGGFLDSRSTPTGVGEIESSGKVQIGDILYAINERPFHGLVTLSECVERIKSTPRPMRLSFQRPGERGVPGIPEGLIASVLSKNKSSATPVKPSPR